MTTYSLPTWFKPAAVEVQWQPEVRSFSSPYGGATQALDLLGGRWRIAAQLPPCAPSAAGAREAWLNRLQGGVHRVSLHHLARPYPVGTARGTITLASSAAQGASTLALAGVATGPNLLVGSSFEVDGPGGIAVGWTAYSAGAVSSPGYFLTSTDVHGAYAQRCQASSIGTSTADRVGVQQLVTLPSGSEGASFTFSLYMRLNSAAVVTAQLYISWLNSSNAEITGATDSRSITTSMARYSLTATAPTGAVSARVYVWFHSRASGAGAFEANVDAAVFERNATATASFPAYATLLAGDMLGCGGQLFQVAEDVTFSDAGTGTVSLVNRTRAALSSGASVTWAKPTAEFMLTALQGVPTLYQIGMAPGHALEFLEAWT